MSKQSVKLARAVHQIFTQQKQSGGERFGRWTSKLAEAMTGPLFDIYTAGMRKYGKPESNRSAIESFASGDENMSWMVAMAKEQALEAARQINEASANMLESGRDYREVFSTDRAALIALDQEHKAQMNCQVYGAKQRKVKLQWVTDSKPCPKICLKLKGKTRNPGKMFAMVNGEPLFSPPAHIHCRCSLVEVSK